MRKLSIVAASAMFMAAVAPAFAADAGPAAGAPDTNATGTPATGTTGTSTSGGSADAGTAGNGTAGNTGTFAGTPAAGTTGAKTSGAPTADPYQTLQGRLDALQKQLDAINTVNGQQTPLEVAQNIQKHLDDLKAAVAKAKAGTSGVGCGKFTLTGLAQVWIGVSTHPDPPYTSAKPPAMAGGTPGAVNSNSRPFQGYFRTQDFSARRYPVGNALDGTAAGQPPRNYWRYHFGTWKSLGLDNGCHDGRGQPATDCGLAVLSRVYARKCPGE